VLFRPSCKTGVRCGRLPAPREPDVREGNKRQAVATLKHVCHVRLLERLPIMWSHVIEKETLKIKELVHVTKKSSNFFVTCSNDVETTQAGVAP
jgi:hypothetical protein